MTDSTAAKNIENTFGFDLTGMERGDWFMGCEKCGPRQQYPKLSVGPAKCGICGHKMTTFVVRDMDIQQRTVPPAEKRHRAFWIKTPAGAEARIVGDPKMSAATKHALAEMIDCAVEAANEGKL